MKIYLDNLDSYYSISHEPKLKPKRDYGAIAAAIYSFTVFGIVIGLTVWTLMQPAYGYLPLDPDLGGYDWFQESAYVLQYCREHASDSPNPVQDLVDNVIITWGWFDGETCVTVKQAHDAFLTNEMEKIK